MKLSSGYLGARDRERGVATLRYRDGMEHSYFGATPWNRTHTIAVGGRQVSADLNCDEQVTSAQLDVVARFVQQPTKFDVLAREAMAVNPDPTYSTLLYVEHHLAELSKDDLQRLFGTTARSELSQERVLSCLQLVRIGLYPADEHQTAVFDYSLDPTVTNYVLAVSFEASGKVTSIEMES
jgi:hypothetical protein